MQRWSHWILVSTLAGSSLALSACGGDDPSSSSKPLSSTITDFRATGAIAGETGLLRVELGDPAGKGVTVTLTSSAPDVLTVPESVGVTEGSTAIQASFEAVAAGNAVITATVGTSTMSVSAVVADSLRLTSLSANAAYVVGMTGTFSPGLNISVPAPITVDLSSSDSDVIETPDSIQIPAFASSFPVGFTALAPGRVDITAEYDGLSRTATIDVVEQAMLTTYSISSRVQTGLNLTPYVYINAVTAEDSVVELTTSDKAVFAVPSDVTIPTGNTYGSYTSVAAKAGTAKLTAEFGDNKLSTILTVVDDVTLTSAYLSSGARMVKGTGANLYLNVDATVAKDTNVTLTVDKPKVLSVPKTGTILAGGTGATLGVTALTEGDAKITAKLGSVTREFFVTVAAKGSLTYISGPSQMLVGTTGDLYVYFDSTDGAMTASLTSSDPEIVKVPKKTVAGYNAVTIEALKAGVSTITAKIGDVERAFVVTVLNQAVLSGVSLPSPLETGAYANMYLSVSPTPLQDVTVSLEFTNPDTLNVPETVTIPANQSYIYVPIAAGEPGYGVLSATANGVTRTSSFTVLDEVLLYYTSFSPSAILVGTPTTLSVSLNGYPRSPFDLSFTYETPDIISGPDEGVITTGSSSGQFLMVPEEAGYGTVLVQANGMSLLGYLTVVDEIVATSINLQSSLYAGQSASVYIYQNAVTSTESHLTLSVDDDSILTVPETLTIPAGSTYAYSAFTGVAAGVANVTVTVDGNDYVQAVTVNPAL